MVSKLFRALAKRVRQIGASLAEKPQSDVDEHVLEHFLLYHGLVGSSPENQRSFKDVRADIKIAIQEQNPLKMGIALKLAPLWWDEKLKTILAEIIGQEGDQRTVATLWPETSDDTWPSRFDPLGHSDWHVRANAASMLAFANARPTVPRMQRALDDAAGSDGKAAFPHVAYALSRLGTDQARVALEKYLYDDEHWFRVDVAGALASWPLAVVGDTLMRAMLSQHTLSDYMAVVISKQHKPKEFLESTHSSASAGACALLLSLLEAGKQTFTADVVTESGALECLPLVIKNAEDEPTPLRIRAAMALSDWLSTSSQNGSAPDQQLQDRVTTLAHSERIAKLIVDYINDAKSNITAESAELRNAVLLSGQLKLPDCVPGLIAMLDPELPILSDVIDALGQIGDDRGAEPLLKLVRMLVSMPRRTGLPLSKQPVADDYPDKAKAYWHVLKALGEINTVHSVDYLIEATSDYAPDKREQALNSVLAILQNHPDKQLNKRVREVVATALNDPAPQIRSAALHGVALLEASDLVSEVLKMTESAEVSVSRKAFETLAKLCKTGHQSEVSTAVKAAIETQGNKYRKEQLSAFLVDQQHQK
jgi:HEAT repeat protein